MPRHGRRLPAETQLRAEPGTLAVNNFEGPRVHIPSFQHFFECTVPGTISSCRRNSLGGSRISEASAEYSERLDNLKDQVNSFSDWLSNFKMLKVPHRGVRTPWLDTIWMHID
jgi:hypothetical protein